MSKEKYCPNCGYIGKPKLRGSFLITLILLFFAIVPGIIYDIWRTTAGRKKCPSCEMDCMIPLDSPIAVSELAGRK